MTPLAEHDLLQFCTPLHWHAGQYLGQLRDVGVAQPQRKLCIVQHVVVVLVDAVCTGKCECSRASCNSATPASHVHTACACRWSAGQYSDCFLVLQSPTATDQRQLCAPCITTGMQPAAIACGSRMPRLQGEQFFFDK
jgi:hypothetical protein